MTTDQEKERKRLYDKYFGEFGTSVPYNGRSYYAPYQLGWQINVGQMRDIAQSRFFKDGDMEKFQKENREIDRYAGRMMNLYGIGIDPDAEE